MFMFETSRKLDPIQILKNAWESVDEVPEVFIWFNT